MAFLVRKLNKRDLLVTLHAVTDLQKLPADIPTMEFRTTDGTLSTWIVDSLDEVADAVLAIAVSSSTITKMDFIIIDTNLLERYGLNHEKTYAGQNIAIPDLQDSHHDISYISIDKLVECVQVYQSIFEMDNDMEIYIRRFTAGEIKDLLKQALAQNRIDESLAPKKLKEELDKLKTQAG